MVGAEARCLMGFSRVIKMTDAVSSAVGLPSFGQERDLPELQPMFPRPHLLGGYV